MTKIVFENYHEFDSVFRVKNFSCIRLHSKSMWRVVLK